MAASIERSRDMQMRNCDVVAAPPGDRIIAKQHGRKTTWHQNNMAASIERSRDMQMRNCDVVAAPPGDRIIAKQCLRGDNRG